MVIIIMQLVMWFIICDDFLNGLAHNMSLDCDNVGPKEKKKHANFLLGQKRPYTTCGPAGLILK